MMINRNNYEELFLLYADNELSACEKNMVERFVLVNNDLEDEFLMLQQSVFKPDKNIKLEDKNFLFRESENFISSNNYQQVFVLLNDNELGESEIKETENFIIQNKGLQDEFNVFKKIKFQPDSSIVFPDKKLLYKKENDGKIVPFKWWASIAAALIAGFGLWIGINYLQKDTVLNGVAINKTKPGQIIKRTNSPGIIGSQKQNIVTVNKNVAQNKALKKLPFKIIHPVSKSNKNVAEEGQVTINNDPLNKNRVKKPNEKLSNEKNNEVVYSPGNVNENLIKKVTNNLENPGTINLEQHKQLNALPPNLYAQIVSSVRENNENYVFYNVTTEEFNKSKIGGFLKRLKRTIVRRSPFNHNNEPEITQQ